MAAIRHLEIDAIGEILPVVYIAIFKSLRLKQIRILSYMQTE